MNNLSTRDKSNPKTRRIELFQLTHKEMKSIKVFLLMAILGFPLSLLAQRGGDGPSITGETIVDAGFPYSYSFTGEIEYWSCVGCEFQFPDGYDPNRDGWPSTITIKWMTEGRQILSVRNTLAQMGFASIRASCTNQIAPMPTAQQLTQAPNFCTGQVDISHPMDDPDWMYYWQDAADGTDVSNMSNTLSVGNAGSYYLRAKSRFGCWSENSVQVTVNSIPTGPTVNAPLFVEDCGLGRLEMNNTNTSDFTFYWQTSPTGTDVTHSAPSRSVTSEGDYFVRGRHNTTGCWTAASTGLHVSPEAITEQPPVDEALLNLPEDAPEKTIGDTNKPEAGTTMVGMNNYVRSYTFMEEVAESSSFADLDVIEVSTATAYFDGLGRPLQEIQKQASPLGNDVVIYHDYDEFGREKRQYLPYANVGGVNDGAFKTDAPVKQYQFYKGELNSNVPKTDWAFTEVELQNSPLNRALAQLAPGESWVGEGRKVSSEILTNTEAEGIRKWEVIDHANGTMELILASAGIGNPNGNNSDVYPNSALTITKTIDEHGNATWQYTDKFGRNILTKADVGEGTFAETYYVYDKFNQLRYVLPPLATQMLSENNWDPTFGGVVTTQSTFKSLIYTYRYDHRGRVIAKRIAGHDDEILMVYNQLDQLVLTQDPKQRTADEWSFTQYDVLGRPVATGVCIMTNRDHAYLIAELEGSTLHTTFDEINKDYVWDKFPFNYAAASAIELHSVSYYDHYKAVDLDEFAYGFRSGEFSEAHFKVDADRVIGLQTASKVKILDGTGRWLWTVSHYDRKGRVIQSVGDNHLEGKDVISTLYHDFNSRVEQTKLRHSASGDEFQVLKRYEYDHANRVLNSYYKYEQQDEELLASFTYNELGEVVTKRLGNGLQKIDYAYNIRGWLTKINGIELEEANGNDREDLWGMELSYDEGFEKKQYNGNISGAKWKSKRDGKVHAYGYQYDKQNRLTQADYRYDTEGTGAWSKELQDFSVFGIDYDLNGNILKLNRQGAIGKDSEGNWIYGAMDRLEYTYKGNRLIAVDDKAASDASAGDFMDIDQLYCSTGLTEYHYDVNGNLDADDNKNLSDIQYNHMNLPTLVNTDEGKVKYIYDAAGIKLRKEVYDENEVLKSYTDYVGEFIYNQNGMEFIHHDEGRLIPGGDGLMKFEYHYKDHLGNLRLSFREEKAEYAITMEVDNAAQEEAWFDHVKETRIVGLEAHSGSAVSDLRGNDATRTMGPATVVSVEKGDKIEFSAYAKYESGGNFGVANGLTIPNLGAEHSFGIEGADFMGNGTGLIFTPLNLLNNDNQRPHAYAVIHLLDKEGNVLESHEKFVAKGANVYNLLSLQLEVENDLAEYAAIYIANESPTDVLFDDLTLSHERLTWQENSYYPFGMAIKPLDKEGWPDHRFTYNGKELEEETGYLDYHARQMDSQLGRFMSVDPHAENYYNHTPYAYVGNNPLIFIDPDGKDWFFYKADGDDEPGWHWQEGSEYTITVDDGNGGTISVTLQGQAAVVVFNGSRNERLADDGTIDGGGAINATVTVYAPDGGVYEYIGYTMTSSPNEFTPIAEGVYIGKRRENEGTGKIPKHYQILNLDGTDGLPTMDGVINANPVGDGTTQKTEIFAHRTNNNGTAYAFTNSDGVRSGVTTGCLVICQHDGAGNNDYKGFDWDLSALGNSLDNESGSRSFLIILKRQGATNNPTLPYETEKKDN